MKKLLLGIAAVCLAGFTFAQDAPLWMRHSVISPDGTTIAFTYKGDIYTVPVAGGRAMQITTNPAYDTAPVWSPDSKRIAFASDRMGSLDVYIVAKDGGEPRRLTTHSGSETPLAFTDAGHVLFSAGIMPVWVVLWTALVSNISCLRLWAATPTKWKAWLSVVTVILP